MALLLLRKPISFVPLSSRVLSRLPTFCSKASAVVDKTNTSATKAPDDQRQSALKNYSSNIQIPPLFSDGKPHLGGYGIEIVDNDTWKVSSGLAVAWQESDKLTEHQSSAEGFADQVDDVTSLQNDPDFDEIDSLRIRGNLFYKLDRDSKEFEEYSFDFHRKNFWKRKGDPKGKEKIESSKKNSNCQEIRRKENPNHISAFEVEKRPQIVTNGKVYDLFLDHMEGPGGIEKKKVRTPTFNQLTAPYHEPFCLDIFISNASVRACVIHRVTSKVVAVAHSISKDIKFDLPSTRNAAACATVGAILAQRALEDDIHDIVYSPRKGERLEGKLQIVLQSIIDSGINVKVKLKQRKPNKGSFRPRA